jgi:hypothetical protein
MWPRGVFIGPQWYVSGASKSKENPVAGSGVAFVRYPGVFNSIAYYAGNPIVEHAFNSYEYPTPTCTTGLTPRGFCCENYSQPYTNEAGPVQTLDVSDIGTPPFSIEQ